MVGVLSLLSSLKHTAHSIHYYDHFFTEAGLQNLLWPEETAPEATRINGCRRILRNEANEPPDPVPFDPFTIFCRAREC